MIERTDRDGIVTLRLAHGKASAMDLELCQAIVQQVEAARDARAIILTGTGSIFSAGVDLVRLTEDGADYAYRFGPALVDAITALFTTPVPVIAACNGHAIAGGCIMAAASDYRLMVAGEARIGVPEALVGVAFPPIALEVACYGMAPQHVRELIYLGKTVLPEEALQKGLIDEIVEPAQLEARAEEIAQHFASIPRDCFRLTKQQLHAEPLRRAKAFEWTLDEVQRIWASPETHAHIRDYMSRTFRKK